MIPEDYSNIVIQNADGTETYKTFLAYDSAQEPGCGGSDPDRVLIFSSENGIQDLIEQKDWAIHAQFKVAPKLWYQLLGVHAYFGKPEEGGKYVPRLWALMPNKKTPTYTKVYEAMKKLGLEHDRRGNGFRPERLLLDFEIAEKVCSY